ncbi:MAG: hypothetical protein NTY19_06655 [Planctomycetota bacterium]|nr:hypothetical protein [Planctomycetota bacterium]
MFVESCVSNVVEVETIEGLSLSAEGLEYAEKIEEQGIVKKAGELGLSAEDQGHLDAFELQLDFIRDRTTEATKKVLNGVLIFGRPGTAKTHTVEATLNEMKASWKGWNSRISPMGLHCMMKENADGVIVVDDVATLCSNKAAVQVLLAGLGGEPGKPRMVTYATKTDRSAFEFTGSFIIIANLLPRRDPITDALISRVRLLEHEPTDEMVAAFMRAKALRGYKDVTPAEALEVVEFVITEARNAEHRLDLRHMTAGWEDYAYWKSGESRHIWQTLVRSGMRKTANDNQSVPVRRADRKQWEQDIAEGLFNQFPDDRTQREQQWVSLTGKASASLYRRRRELEVAGQV